MNKGDVLVDRGADRLQGLADRAAARGDSVGEWLSEELRNQPMDAIFRRAFETTAGQFTGDQARMSHERSPN